MKQLVLRNSLYEKIYRSLGVVCMVMIIVIIITGDSNEWPFWVQIIAMLLLGLAFLSLNFGTLTNRLTVERGELIIRWYTRPGRTTIQIHEIERDSRRRKLRPYYTQIRSHHTPPDRHARVR
jgi:membrane protein implicated in regulation of membrane protease activity